MIVSRKAIPLPKHSDDFRIYNEVLPELYDIADMVDKKLAVNGHFRLSIFDKAYKTREQVMRSAFPNTWLLLEGPQEGKRLVQDFYGEVTEVKLNQYINKISSPQNLNFFTPVTSFREHCEAWLKEHAQEVTKESLSGKTPKRTESYTQQEKNRPDSKRQR